MNTKQIPVIINNRNRLSTLSQLIAWLESVGTQNIFIIDNASQYEPLLEYYKTSPHNIFYLRENVGYLAFWELGIWERFKSSHYIYTDPDVVPTADCPHDYLEVFMDGLQRYDDIGKVGFSLKIDDLPEHYVGKQSVLSHESQFWIKKRDNFFYDSLIDTTLALYKPKSRGGYWVRGLRSPPPYIARHLPWYVDSRELDDEELFYRAHANRDSSWTVIDKKVADKGKIYEP